MIQRNPALFGKGTKEARVWLSKSHHLRYTNGINKIVEAAGPDLFDLSGAAVSRNPKLVAMLAEVSQAGEGLGMAPVPPELVTPVIIDEAIGRLIQSDAGTHLLEEQDARGRPILVSFAQDGQGCLAVELPLPDECLGPLAEEPIPIDQGVVEVEDG
jgi:hypothetical protein